MSGFLSWYRKNFPHKAAHKPKTTLAKKKSRTEVGAVGPLKPQQCKKQAARSDSHVQVQPGHATHGRKGLLGLGPEGDSSSKEPAVPKKAPSATWKKVSCGQSTARSRTRPEDTANRTRKGLFVIPEDAANRTGRGPAVIPEETANRTGRGPVVIPENTANKAGRGPAVIPEETANRTRKGLFVIPENTANRTGRGPAVIAEDTANRTGKGPVVIPEVAANRTGRGPAVIPEDAANRTGRDTVVFPNDAANRMSSRILGGIPRGFGGCTLQPYLSNKHPSKCPAHAKTRKDLAERTNKVPLCTYKPCIGGWKTKRHSRPVFFKGTTSAVVRRDMETRRVRSIKAAEPMFPDLSARGGFLFGITSAGVVYCSLWILFTPGKADLEPGDLIEIFRFGYQHWAVYVGNGYVIHLAPPSEYAGAGCASLMSTLTDKALIKKELLMDVVGRNRYRVNNKHDSKHPPLPPTKIVQRAENMVGQELLYKVTSENCEHFVTELRYGVAKSDQVRDALVGVGIAGLGLATLGIISAMVTRKKKQNQ